MEIAMIYIIMYAVIAIMILVTLALLCTFIFMKKKRPDAPKAVTTALIASFPTALVVTALLVVWALSHRSYPAVNDWHFLGSNISDIEREYESFDRMFIRDDGSGYAILMTERIVRRSMFDSDDYSCYRMEFDSAGRIVKVNCERPLGG